MTIKEVAELAGVSSAAVSRYFNGGSLSEEKRRKISEVVKETEYKPNAAAQLMRTGKSGQIGVIVPHIHSDSLSQIMSGIARALEEQGYIFILGCTGGSQEKEVRYLEAMQRNQMEGIILMGSVLTPYLRDAIDRCEVPVVVTGQNFEGVPCVYHDDKNAMRELTGRILKKRKKLVYIGVTEEDHAAGLARRRGVEMAMEDAGLDPRSLRSMLADFTVESGYEVMQTLLKEEPELDGVVCATDLIAHGAMRALKDAGKKVPRDVSIVGVGNHWSDEVSDPPLTTVKFYYRESGRTAVEMLLGMIGPGNNRSRISQIKMGYEIVERRSI